MEYVHSQRDLKGRNMMHLDLKPENVLLANAGTQADPHWICKVADFGMDGDETESSDGAVTLVRTASPSVKATTSGEWTGTPEYMSPEATGQLKSVEVGQAADVFSFAIVLWEMLAWHRVRLGFGDAALQTVWVAKDGEELRGKHGMPGTLPEDGVPQGAYQREDMRCVTVWMMKGARPEAEGQSQWPTGLLLLIQACWAHMPGDRLTFPQVVRVLQAMQDSTDGLLWQHETVNAPQLLSKWLKDLGVNSGAECFDGYIQGDLEEMTVDDKDFTQFLEDDDLNEYIEEIAEELAEAEREAFTTGMKDMAAQQETAEEQQSPRDKLLTMTGGGEEDVAQELAAKNKELTAKDQEIALLKAQLQKLQPPKEGVPPV